MQAVRFIAIAIYGLCFSLAHAETLTGQVVKISDGDTLTILDASRQQHKIRLSGIDAPERKQAFGTVSRQYLASLAFGKAVTVEWYKRDRYQRIIGVVLLDGRDVNLELVKAGLAWHYKYYENEQPLGERLLYTEAEEVARLDRVGLWSDPSPIPPWDFRRK
ncbi:thermonuclease family protein [Nitrosospira briensis]|uniref:thermonuclease family protein n=1 Tax=Nitrosospira briensis TaxID=35799 RepID=UPI0008EAE211|nr:thermonuclease family protein [Nitrosospira briensis]SFO14102.1 Endonuclease YncB, thermonuclease family [Nitrosospira briensis]